VDATYGAEMISLAARFGRGLPADVVPLEVDALSSFGHAEMPLYGEAPVFVACDPVLPMGSRRQITRLAAKALVPDGETLALPEGAPYGAVLVDTDACTLCLSCVSLCPSGALGDNPDMPQLRFQEDACLQCGLCTNICPEKAITLQPQLNLTDEALSQQVLHEEEPFACIECGALFGVKSTVEKITEKLAGNHAMVPRWCPAQAPHDRGLLFKAQRSLNAIHRRGRRTYRGSPLALRSRGTPH